MRQQVTRVSQWSMMTLAVVKGKRVTSQSLLGQLGANLIEKTVLEMGWLWRPTPIFDAGIDGEIEVRDPTTGEASNCILKVQAKATSQSFPGEDADSFYFTCDAEDLDYWLRGNVPVVLVVCRPSSGEAYWVSLRDYFGEQSVRKSRRVRFDKRKDAFTSFCAPALRRLASPRDSGLYSAPLHQSEILYTNLLRVSRYADRIFIADTDYRDPKILWAKLNSLATAAGPEWLLSEKKLVAFQDLSVPPFSQVCDRGTLEDFDSTEWAEAEDRGRRTQFVRLLILSLRELARRRHLRYHRSNEYFYFPATKDLRTSHVTYESFHRQSSREVFKMYYSKKEPNKMAYCRHSAFRGHFVRLSEGWYLELTPTYHFTYDGTKDDMFREERLKGIKRLERNPAVLGQVMMWSSYLRRQTESLFQKSYAFLSLGELATLQVETTLPDLLWYGAEDPSEREDLSSRDNSLDLYDA